MLDLTERLTMRLTFDELNQIKAFATENSISTSGAVRQLINESLSNDQKQLNQKMLVEILMILRHKIDEAELSPILALVEEFKLQQGIK